MHVVCHMAASVDGRLLPGRWSAFAEPCPVGEIYEETAARFDYLGWMIGRVTMAEYSDAITESAPAPLRGADEPPAQSAPVDPRGRRISVAFDFKGKLHYGRSVQESGEQIVAVVSNRVSDDYIDELRRSGVGVVAVPVDGHELEHALKRLAADYGDGVWMLEGGAIINAAFFEAGLVNEVSTIVYPAIDGGKSSPAIYQAASEQSRPAGKVSLKLKKSEVLAGGAVWLDYDVINRQHAR